ncbi:WD repeat-containing on Y chromosome-like isoform X2, partial [Brachionus plicatilis]
MDYIDDPICTDQVQKFDGTKTIADLYYSKKKSWMNILLLRKEASDIQEENGRFIQNIAIKMNENTKKKIRAENHLEFEEILRVEHLRELKKKFFEFTKIKSSRIFVQDFLFDPKKKKQAESLNQDEFLEVLKTLPFYDEFEFELEKLFQRIDHHNIGCINWTDVSNYFTIHLQENEYSEPKIKLCEHNKREVTVKVLKIENPLRFVNISR